MHEDFDAYMAKSAVQVADLIRRLERLERTPWPTARAPQTRFVSKAEDSAPADMQGPSLDKLLSTPEGRQAVSDFLSKFQTKGLP